MSLLRILDPACGFQHGLSSVPYATLSPRMARSTSLTLGATVRELREARGVSREVLAVEAGLGTGTLARLELGKSDPPWSTLRAVAAALEVTMSDLTAAVEAHELADPLEGSRPTTTP
jgi:DNA-binding XRE family transcriptional regulator